MPPQSKLLSKWRADYFRLVCLTHHHARLVFASLSIYSPTETSPLLGSEKPNATDDTNKVKEKEGALRTTSDKKKVTIAKQSVSLTDSIHEIILKRPRPHPCLLVLHFISSIAVLASLCLVASQLIPIIIAYPNVGFLQVALRFYVALFCIMFILVGLQVPLPFLKHNITFQNYISRGFLISFNGLIGLEQAYSVQLTDVIETATSSGFHVSWSPLFMRISSWTMVVIGYVYIVMGVLCMKQLHDKLQENYQERLDEYNRAKPIDV